MLHIINTSQALTDSLPFLAAEDAVVLIEDGVYAVSQNHSLPQPIFALTDDINARGLSDKVQPEIKLIDYSDFVELTIRFHPSQSW